MNASPARWKVAVALFVVYLVWGTTHYATLLAVQSLPPFFMTSARFLLSGILVMAFVSWQDIKRVTPRQVSVCAVSGILMSFASMSLAVLAIASGVASGLMACIVATMPFWFTFLVHRSGERVSSLAWTGVAIGVFGACLLMFDKNLASTPRGTAMAFLSPICWAVGSYLVRRSDMPAMAVSSSLQWLTGGLFGLVVSLCWEVQSVGGVWRSATPQSLLAWGYLVVFGTLLTYSAYLWLVRHVSAPLASSSSFVNPVVAVAVGVFVANEEFSRFTFFSIALILLAVFLIIRRPQKSSVSSDIKHSLTPVRERSA